MSEAERLEEEIFETARHLQDAERVTYLDQACAHDRGLRRRIEGLLGAFSRAGDLLSEPVLPREALSKNVASPVSARPGDHIGPYKLLQQIGEGGCGIVYMAEQEHPLRRRVALKVLKLGMDTRQVIARFEAERQALALMDHPNIAKVLDAGATATGRPYFVMELVRGVKITDFCDEHRTSMRERLQLFIQVCQAVQHAHQKGIIHRDLKPSNILVTLNDGVAVPKVIDFGIAKATTGQPLTDKTLFTAFEQFVGTPAYMSPEQAVMTSLDIDTRTDIYSLGVLLYELLTGHTPFDSAELLQVGLDEMRRTIREKEPARPSTRLSTLAARELTIAAKRRQVDESRLAYMVRGDLDWIVMKCLEKDRSRRYETANGLAADLRRHLANEPVVACPPNAVYRFQKAVRRHKTAFGAVTAFVIVLIAGVAVSWSQATRAKQLRDLAESKERQSYQVAEFLKETLKSAKRSLELRRDPSTTTLLEILDQTPVRLDRDLREAPEVEAELRLTIGDVYQLLGQYEKAETMYRRALALHRKLLGNEQPVVAQLLNNLGVTLVEQDRLAEADQLYVEALDLRRRLMGPTHASVSESLHHRAFLLRRQGKLPQAEEAIRESLTIRRATPGHDARAIAESMQGLATILFREGKLSEAEQTLREALAVQTPLLGAESAAVADMLEDLGLVLAAQGRQAEAERSLAEALDKLRKVLGDTHPDTITCMAMLLNTLLAEGKYAQAEPLARECWLAREKKMPGHPKTFNARSLLGGCLLGLKRYQEAEPLLLSSFEGLRPMLQEDKIPWEGRYVVGDTLKRIIQLYGATDQADKAAEWQSRLAEFERAGK